MPLHVPEHPVRFVTAASLFDGHDAAINIMRRILQSQGAEVVHLGHNRSVDDVVTAALARLITVLEAGRAGDELVAELGAAAARRTAPVLGITGTGGSGKSSLTDELVRRFRLDLEDKLSIAVLAVDPTRRKGGGALLGDRIRMNSIGVPNVYFRSMATRGAVSEVPPSVPVAVAACQAAGYDLVIVETPGIGQGDAGIVPLVDVPIYVMTPEFGAASQLEKIDMLDFAEAVVINKFERRGAEDALRDVRRQVARNRELFGADPESLPAFGTIASRFNDDGVSALSHRLKGTLGLPAGTLSRPAGKVSTHHAAVV